MNKMLYVSEYGAMCDGVTLDTVAVQRAVDSCSFGDTVVFTEGTYCLSTVFLKSGVTIMFRSGTKIFGAESIFDYAEDEKLDYALYQDGSHSYFHCAMFVAENCSDVAIRGDAVIDMRSVWDCDNVRDNAHRGAKFIAFKNCTNVIFEGFTVLNATDLAVYFAGCKNVYVGNLKLRVHIDGISPDNCHNVLIENCNLLCGDDGIVFKSSYTLNRLDMCDKIVVRNCSVQSRCNAVKFGTETNGGFSDIQVDSVNISNTRVSGIAIESVDGAILKDISIKNISMKNVNAPLFVHLGKRLRGPVGTKIGDISNIVIENVTADGPYEQYDSIEWNYRSFTEHDTKQYPWKFGRAENFDDNAYPLTKQDAWQMTSNVCGLVDHPLKNITIKNVKLHLNGGVKNFETKVSEEAQDYPEVYVYGRILPAKGIYFRHIDGLNLINCHVDTDYPDVRENFVFEDISNLIVN